MSDVAIDPASPEPGCLDGCNPPLQGLWASGTPRDMSQSGARRRGHLQRMMVLLFIAAEIDRLGPPLGLLQAEQVLEEMQRTLEVGRQ
jgi:hypothetical protein